MIHVKPLEERIKDAEVLLSVMNQKKGTTFTLTGTVFSEMRGETDYSEPYYSEIIKRLVKKGLPKADAKNLAWVITCPRPWDGDQPDKKPFLSSKCSCYRRWDRFWETANEALQFPH